MFSDEHYNSAHIIQVHNISLCDTFCVNVFSYISILSNVSM